MENEQDWRDGICAMCDGVGDCKPRPIDCTKIKFIESIVSAAEKRGAEKERERAKPLLSALKNWLSEGCGNTEATGRCGDDCMVPDCCQLAAEKALKVYEEVR